MKFALCNEMFESRPMAEVSGDWLTPDVADVPTQVSHMSRLMTECPQGDSNP